MINSIVANVVPPNVPSSRKGITPFGQGEATQPQAQVSAPTVEQGDKFVKQTPAKA